MQPATSNQQPATSNQQPATSNQQPATSNQQPATSNQQRHYYSLIFLFLLFACGPPGSETNKSETNKPKNTEAQIIKWTFADNLGTATFDHANRTVQVDVLWTPWRSNIEQLTASYTLSDSASITPDPEETARDYTSPVKFTVTAEDGTKKEYTVSVAFLPDRSTLSFEKDNTEFPNLTTFNSKNNVKVTVSAGNIPDALEARVEAKVKSLRKDTPSNGVTLGNNPPVTTPQSIAAFPTVSKPAQNTEAQKTKTLELEVSGSVISSLYLVEAKVFVRPLGTNGAWIEAKTKRRQYALYRNRHSRTPDDILEIEYDKFIVAKGGEVTLKIKKKDNDMRKYKHIELNLLNNDSYILLAFYIKTQTPAEKQKLILNNNDLASIIQGRFATTDIVSDYKYEDDTYQIKLKDFQKNTFFRFSLINKTGVASPHIFILPPILVTE